MAHGALRTCDDERLTENEGNTVQTIDEDDTFDPALDRLDQWLDASAQEEPDWGEPYWSCPRVPRGRRPRSYQPGCPCCYWGWTDRPGGGARRCRHCNLPARVLRRHEGRRIRQGRRVVRGWPPETLARAKRYLALDRPFHEAPF